MKFKYSCLHTRQPVTTSCQVILVFAIMPPLSMHYTLVFELHYRRYVTANKLVLMLTNADTTVQYNIFISAKWHLKGFRPLINSSEGVLT